MESRIATPTLHFLCGKMAAGKSTFARELARQHDAVLLEEDHFLAKLFPGQIRSITDYVEYSGRVKSALSDHIVALLASGKSVVLDFPGNTRTQRQWFRQLFERANAAHELHYVDVSDELCKHQLRERSKALPSGAAFTSDAEFEAVTKYFQPPADDENFKVSIHRPKT
ncbi:MAG TPA: ATP-binding protein [Steroidobacteraceae bacterium]